MSKTDLVTVSTSEVINLISHSFSKYVDSNIIKEHPAVFLKGSPGLGKSEAVREVCKILERKHGKHVHLLDVRLNLFNPIDLRGIPVADKEAKSAIWLKPEIFTLSEDEDVINILFLDELTSSPKSIQASAYQIALDRRIGEHHLAKNTFVIAAGNKEGDNGVTYEMPTPLQNRFIHFEITNNVTDWLTWAKSSHINEEIIAFISKYPAMLNNESYDGENMLVTPRSWERLSKMLHVLGGDIKDNIPFVNAIIGNEMTNLLLNRKTAYGLNDILSGEVEVPSDLEAIEQVTSLLENSIEQFNADSGKIKVILPFVEKLPAEYGLRVFRLLSKNISKEAYEGAKTEFESFVNHINDVVK